MDICKAVKNYDGKDATSLESILKLITTTLKLDGPKGGKHDMTTFLERISRRNVDIALFIIHRRLNWNVNDDNPGFNPVMDYIAGHDVLCIKDDAGMTALHHAVRNSVTIVRALIKAGAGLNSHDDAGMTALHYAARKKDVEALSLLIEANARLDSQDDAGMTALHYAVTFTATPLCYDIDLCIVQTLLDARADVDVCDNHGKTVLHHVAINKRWGTAQDFVEVIVNAGVGIDSQDIHGRTALHYAAMMDFRGIIGLECVTSLIKVKARVDVRDNADKTPIDIAAETSKGAVKNRARVIELLKAGSSQSGRNV